SLDRPWTLRGAIDPQGPQAWYWIAEHFDQDAAGDLQADENTRFQLWNAPGKTVKLTGYLEHQYGHRVGVTVSDGTFKRSIDLLSPADVMIPERLTQAR